MNKIIKIDYIYLLAFYALAHVWIFLLNDALYWDDWTLYNVDSRIIIDTFKQAGAFFNLVSHLHIAMLSVGPWLYKALTFLLMFISGLFLYKIIELNKYKKLFSLNDYRFEFVLLFLILPFYSTRVYLIHFTYTVCYFLFFLGWRYKEIRFIALPAFFLSFITNSLLVFYALPIAHMFFEKEGILTHQKIIRFVKLNLDYLALPFIFFIIKIKFFKPYGNYVGYNEQYSLANLIKTPFLQIFDLINLNINIASALLISILAHYTLTKRNNNNINCVSKNIFYLGFAALVIGLFPYWILGHKPSFLDALSRHQLLMPFGTALIFVYLFFNKINKNVSLIGLAAVIGASVTYSIERYVDMRIDYQKQQQIVSFLRRDKNISNNCLVLFNDQSKQFNAFSRSYRFYEWDGLLKFATKRTDNFGIEASDFDKFQNGYYDKFYNNQKSTSYGNLKLSSCKVNIFITTDSDSSTLRKVYNIITNGNLVIIKSIRERLIN